MTNNFKTGYRVTSLLVVLTFMLAGVVPTFGSAQKRSTRRRAPRIVYYTVPTNTVIRVRMNEQLNSKTARVGDRFSTTVEEPVYASGGTQVVPVGSRIWGRVASVRPAGRRTPGNITVTFTSIAVPSGKSYAINGSLASLDSDDVADNEGTVKGKSNRKRDAVFIGGGAAGGALIGAIAGGGKGAAIGALLGGGLGTGARVYEKEKEANVKSGTEFGVILNRPVALPKA